MAEQGEPGEEKELQLELKLLADVGLVGLPNAGKSTLLGRVTRAKPKVADYPFTTLAPNLGIASIDGKSLVIADIPGLIEGASKGKGLGIQFLKHVERSKVILHLVDFWEADPSKNYLAIRAELESFSKDLAKKPELVVFTKTEQVDPRELTKNIASFKKEAKFKGKVLAISSLSGDGLDEMLRELVDTVEEAKKVVEDEVLVKPVTKTKRLVLRVPLKEKAGQARGWQIKKDSNYYIITGADIEKFALRTDLSNPYSVERLYDILHKMRIYAKLEAIGYDPTGDFRLKVGKVLLPREDQIWG